jgi:integrase
MSNDENADDGRIAKRAARRMVFTDKNVLSLPARAKGYMVWDGGNGRGSGEVSRGLGIWVSPLGTKSYRSMFYFPGSAKSHTRHLGRVGEDLTLAEARARCREDRAKARKGIDPRVDDPSRSDTFKAAVDDYVNRYQIGQEKNVRAEECRRVLLADTKDWHLRPIGTIHAREIQARLDLVRDGSDELKPRPPLANLLYARMKPFFAWSAKPNIGKIQHSPMVGIDKPFNGQTRRVRDWFKDVAADEVIKQVWAAADQLGGVEGKYLKVLLLTGKRRTALAEMKWEHITANWFWNAPEGNKNKRLHAVPLSSLVARILHPRQERGYVFPGNRDGRVDAGNLTRAVVKAGGREDFFLHGLRHIAETKLGELKVPHHVRDLLFDHASGRGSGKVYDHHEYEAEMRDALERWAAHIERLISPSENVAVLR